jgi:hypothetical protein
VADEPIDLETDVTSLFQAMVADGVDVSDESAVRNWLSAKGFPSPEDDPDEEFDEDDEFEEISLKEAYGLPDRLPPLRLPPDSELAEAARISPMLAKARALAEWVGTGKAITEDGDLADPSAAAEALHVDQHELAHLWDLAGSVDLVEIEGDTVTAGSAFDDWPDGEDEDVLDIWATAFAVVMTCLDLDAELHGDEEVDFTGAGGAVMMSLFLARSEGLPYTELSELIAELALVPDSWLATHGEPVQVLLGRMLELGAVTVDDEIARLTPVARWAVWAELQEADVEVDVLPPVEEMTAGDLVAAAEGMTEEELTAESDAWLTLRSPADAAKELLEVAATAEAADRMFATSVVNQLGSAAEPHWREALDDPRLRSYAKLALELQPETEDIAWLLTDVLAATTEADGPEHIAEQLRDAEPAGQEEQIFDLMWRLPHPDAGEVLTLLGTHHPDKQVAKAARKAAFKVASHGD